VENFSAWHNLPIGTKSNGFGGLDTRFTINSPAHVKQDKPHFLIDDGKCTECLGDHADPQCAAICPIEMAIVNELGEFLNPPGSLTGIPEEKLKEFGLWREAA
jgi:ferredoxin